MQFISLKNDSLVSFLKITCVILHIYGVVSFWKQWDNAVSKQIQRCGFTSKILRSESHTQIFGWLSFLFYIIFPLESFTFNAGLLICQSKKKWKYDKPCNSYNLIIEKFDRTASEINIFTTTSYLFICLLTLFSNGM